MFTRIFIFLLLLPTFAFAQQKLPLKSILEQIGARHGVRFNYIEDEIVMYAMVAPDENLSLENKLAAIQKQTQLRFEKVSDKYYSVSNNAKLDKPLCGYLLDSESGRPIENAQIFVHGSSGEVYSKADGYFELPVFGSGVIQIHHLGYKDLQIEPRSIYVPDCPTIKMNPVVQTLAPVLAHRYIATGITKNDDASLTVRPGKFGILPGLTEPDVLLAMQQIPGISSVDETVSNINVRGGSHDQNLFLWNGIRMFQTGHFFGLISAFNPMLATNVSISKNGSSALYGEGVSAVVDVSSHTKKIDSCYNAISVDLINANFFSKIKLSKKATIQAAGRRTFTDLVTTPTFKMYRDRVFDNTEIYDVTNAQKVAVRTRNDFYFYDFSLQYHQKIGERHEFVLDGIGIRNEVNFTQKRSLDSISNAISQQDWGASLHWRSQWNANHLTEFQGYGSMYELKSDARDFAQGSDRGEANNIRDVGFRLRHSYAFSQAIDLTFAYQYNHISIENSDRDLVSGLVSRIEQTSASHAAITEANYVSQNKTSKVRAGLRLNYFERYQKLMPEPRVVFVQNLTPKLKLELVGERKSQTISQLRGESSDFLGIENKRWFLANESSIPVQKSTQVSAGLAFEHAGWLVTLDNFYKKVSGINAQEQDFRNQFENVQATGSYSVLGSEVFVQKNVGKFYSWISYSYNDNRYDFDRFSPSRFDNNFAVKHAVSAAGIYEWNELRFAVGAKWHSGRVTTLPVDFAIDESDAANSRVLYSEPNADRLKSYFQLNFSASKSWVMSESSSLSASISILNITNRKNVLNQFYRINSETNTAERIKSYSLGLTPNAMVKWTF